MFTLVEYQCNCMGIDLSDRTNNVLVIKYFDLLAFPLQYFEIIKKSQIHTYCVSVLIYSQNCTYKA